MSEQVNTPSNQVQLPKDCGNNCNHHNHHACCRSHHRIGRFIGLLVILGIGFMAGKSFGFEHGWCHESSPDFISGKPIDSDKISKMAVKRIDHMLTDVDASKEQKAKAIEIVKNSVLNGTSLADTLRNNHLKMMALLSAKEIDKVAIEELRSNQSKTMDELSKQATQTMVDVAEVLSPEQRTKLSEKLAKHGDWMHN